MYAAILSKLIRHPPQGKHLAGRLVPVAISASTFSRACTFPYIRRPGRAAKSSVGDFQNGNVGGDSGFGIVSTSNRVMSSLTRAQFLRANWERQPVSPSIDAIARISSACLAMSGVYCRSCADECTTQAILFHPIVGGAARPGIVPDRCTGCGDCRASCPVQAIVLNKRDDRGETT